MKIVIGDISEEELRSLPRNRINTWVLAHEGMRIYPCIGCMDCFGRRVGHCGITDALTEGLERLGYFEELEFVSACLYGGFSPMVKSALDRLFAYLRPAAEVRKGETRFSTPAVGKIDLVFRFYDIRSETERKTALEYTAALEKLLNAEKSTVLFYRSKKEMLAGSELRGTLEEIPKTPVPEPEEDFEEPMRPAEEDFGEPIRLAEEDFEDSMRLAEEDFGEPIRLADEDFGEPVRPAEEDFEEPMGPAEEGFEEPLQPAEKDFEEPMGPAEKDFSEILIQEMEKASDRGKPDAREVAL